MHRYNQQDLWNIFYFSRHNSDNTVDLIVIVFDGELVVPKFAAI
jgi:hypothetical protein